MCGIIAVLRRRARRATPSQGDALAPLESAMGSLGGQGELHDRLQRGATALERLDKVLSGVPGTALLVRAPDLAAQIDAAMQTLEGRVDSIERSLDSNPAVHPSELEDLNRALLRCKDALWAIRRDRLGNARAVADLAGTGASDSALAAYASIQNALSALDRLEVRGRDSAGLTVLVTEHGLDLASPALSAMLSKRSSDPLFTTGSVRAPDGHLSFVYKAAAEIGELGDNTRALRSAIREDSLLKLALQAATAQALVLGHTRWASVGIISQPNAHPVNQEEISGPSRPYVTAVLNGDVDNYADLKAREGLAIAEAITTDTKVIPILVARRLAEGLASDEAFLRTVASFHGSVAIGLSCAHEPDKLWLAQRGSGQALYVGLAEDTFLVASEPYGLVEETATYMRLDGETPGNPQNPSASQGQVVVLDRRLAGELAGITRIAYDGTPLPLREKELKQAQITTRDIDRGAYPHYLLKEISEAPVSFAKTLRGKLRDEGGKLSVVLPDEAIPQAVRARLQKSEFRRILVIGQGTAAVAGQGVAAFLQEVLARAALTIQALPATELSGFGLGEDMRDCLVVAISQSGTTTDTNRTVDLVKARGASVLAIVNRRNSDLCDKAHGVLYTSDGRDVEMSVASTKAFYAQIAAGFLLSLQIARLLGVADPRLESELLMALRSLPDAMRKVLAKRDKIAETTRPVAQRRRYWALVGNGKNRVAAQEIRIKLSELCYKSIACDATEDKKHIDLSSEPMILVCAAGLAGSTADDVAKEVAIYKAHKAAPIVIATEGENRFAAAHHVIHVPVVHPSLAFVLSTVAGHLFGYACALAIDSLARPLREARAAIESLVSHPGTGSPIQQLEPRIKEAARQFFKDLDQGLYDGAMEARTAVRIASLLRYVQGLVPLESFEAETGKAGTPGRIVDELTQALTLGIEQLTRPVDAIKHQAKTVTVGISRNDEALLLVPLVQKVVEAGAARDRLPYRELRQIAALDPAVRQVLGWTRYRIDGDPAHEGASVHVIDQGGIAKGLPSRTAANPSLKGTKHLVALEKRSLVAQGRSDGRPVLIVPEVHENVTTGITLLHVQLHDRLPAATLRGVLEGYRNRFAALKDAVTETEPAFREDLLETMPVADLLCAPIHALADRWRSA